MSDFYNPLITEETFAAWLDGTLPYEQESMFLDACSHNNDLQELLDANDQVEEDYENLIEFGYNLPYEFNSDFEIPQINDLSESDDVYSDNYTEPYEQGDEEFDESEYYGDADYDDNATIENYTLLNLDDGIDYL